VLLQHGAGGSKDAPYLDAVRLPWVRAGAAVATIDFPLHGERASAKLSERLLALLPSQAPAPDGAAGLWTGFVHQAVVDLRRALDALAVHPEVDAARIAYAGLSLGTVVGALFCADEPRVRAAALAVGGGGRGPDALDPARHVGRIAPRPLLFVNALRDATVPRAAAEALHAAAREPKQVLWFDCTHAELPGAALKAMWTFLREHLGAP
jgi:dienelactone hydrolase